MPLPEVRRMMIRASEDYMDNLYTEIDKLSQYVQGMECPQAWLPFRHKMLLELSGVKQALGRSNRTGNELDDKIIKNIPMIYNYIVIQKLITQDERFVEAFKNPDLPGEAVQKMINEYDDYFDHNFVEFMKDYDYDICEYFKELDKTTQSFLEDKTMMADEIVRKDLLKHVQPIKEVKIEPVDEPIKEEKIEPIEEPIKEAPKDEIIENLEVVQQPDLNDNKVELPQKEAPANDKQKQAKGIIGGEMNIDVPPAQRLKYQILQSIKELEAAKTFVNSSEYKTLIKSLREFKESTRTDDEYVKEKLGEIGKNIDDYIKHKAVGGVNPNAYKKLAAVQHVDERIAEYLKKEHNQIRSTGYKTMAGYNEIKDDLKDLPLALGKDKLSKIQALVGDDEFDAGKIAQADNCMCRIILSAGDEKQRTKLINVRSELNCGLTLPVAAKKENAVPVK